MNLPPDSNERTRDGAPTLEQTQRWMQAVLMHPAGVASGVNSAAAREQIAIDANELEAVIPPSSRLTPERRLAVYSNAYTARLIECLAQQFPALVATTGKDAFADLAWGYLRAHPSRSYTLNHLGAQFAAYLDQSRPADLQEGDSLGWPDLLVDLARLEWHVSEVFDGPGCETSPPLGPEALSAIAPHEWPDARLNTAPSLRLVTLRFPLNDYYTAVRRGHKAEMPKPGQQFLALARRDYVVWRYELTPNEHKLLAALAGGESVGDAIERTDESYTAEQLRNSFYRWGRWGFFADVERPAA